ncbi:MAG: Asp23/Gls24 family envelope stress response protein [Clostridia bacterium]
MTPEKETNNEVYEADGGKIIFAPDVIATIASLAATEVDGVDSMSGNVVEGLTGMLGKKSYTKGVKVDVVDEKATVDISITAKYGFKIHEVCMQIQQSVKSAIETMTGLNVVTVNVAVQAVTFEKAEIKEAKKEKEKTE